MKQALLPGFADDEASSFGNNGDGKPWLEMTPKLSEAMDEKDAVSNEYKREAPIPSSCS
jgi:hypothetical protein